MIDDRNYPRRFSEAPFPKVGRATPDPGGRNRYSGGRHLNIPKQPSGNVAWLPCGLMHPGAPAIVDGAVARNRGLDDVPGAVTLDDEPVGSEFEPPSVA